MTVIPNAGKGNCLFLAPGFGLNPLELGAAAFEHLRKHEARYKPWWDGLPPDQQSKPSWSEYFKYFSANGSGAGSPEIFCCGSPV